MSDRSLSNLSVKIELLLMTGEDNMDSSWPNGDVSNWNVFESSDVARLELVFVNKLLPFLLEKNCISNLSKVSQKSASDFFNFSLLLLLSDSDSEFGSRHGRKWPETTDNNECFSVQTKL